MPALGPATDTGGRTFLCRLLVTWHLRTKQNFAVYIIKAGATVQAARVSGTYRAARASLIDDGAAEQRELRGVDAQVCIILSLLGNGRG